MHFKELKLKETSVRDWKKAYLKELKGKRESSAPGDAVTINKLPAKRRGRPPLIGEKLDESLRNLSVQGGLQSPLQLLVRVAT